MGYCGWGPLITADPALSALPGEIRAWLAARGMPIGPFDVLIAGQARARGLTLVSQNLREFARDPGLETENWGSPHPR